jgi:hypothetical protein
LSVFDSLDEARIRARNLPAMGAWIAEVQITVGGPIYFEQTGRDPHHYTLWGDPSMLFNRVTMVEPVG